MKIRTFVYMLLGFFGLGIVGYGLYLNVQILNAPFRIDEEHTIPVLWIVVAAFVLGFFMALLFGIVREGKLFVDRWRKWREQKRTIRIEERYYEGVQAVVEGRDEDALRNFLRILEESPDHFNALLKA